MKVVKARINSQHEDISSHLLLSIFKIAEVDVVYPTPPSSAIATNRPDTIIYFIICLITIMYNLRDVTSAITITTTGIVNSLTNLSTKTSPSYHIVPFQIYIIEYILSITKCDVFINVVNDSHQALALDDAHTNTNDAELSVDINLYKITEHIIAVNTIYDNLYEIIANANVTKYFSSVVYYKFVFIMTEMLLVSSVMEISRPLLMGFEYPLA